MSIIVFRVLFISVENFLNCINNSAHLSMDVYYSLLTYYRDFHQ